MKPAIHPAYNELNVICACGHTFKTRSTHKGDIRVEICSQCHPFFTGKQKLIDTAGRVDKFEKKYKATRGGKAQPVAELYSCFSLIYLSGLTQRLCGAFPCRRGTYRPQGAALQ